MLMGALRAGQKIHCVKNDNAERLFSLNCSKPVYLTVNKLDNAALFGQGHLHIEFVVIHWIGDSHLNYSFFIPLFTAVSSFPYYLPFLCIALCANLNYKMNKIVSDFQSRGMRSFSFRCIIISKY